MNDTSGEMNFRLTPEAIMTHPLFKQDTALITPPIKEMYADVKRRIVLRDMSSAYVAPSGAGKSMAVTVLHAFLQMEFPGTFVLMHSTHNQQYASIRAFFKHFLASVGHREQRGETFDLRQRLLRALVDRARVAGMSIVVLLLDEANAMKVDDFLFLKDVGNDLAKESIQLITILVGQSPELDIVLDKLMESRKLDLLSRFGLRRRILRQCGSVTDLKAIFAAIDSHEYPIASGITWTAFFLPKAFKAGFRLVQQVENFDLMLEKILGHKGAERSSFPTRQLFAAIRIFLLEMAINDSEDFVVPKDAWKDAIDEALMKSAFDLSNHIG